MQAAVHTRVSHRFTQPWLSHRYGICLPVRSVSRAGSVPPGYESFWGRKGLHPHIGAVQGKAQGVSKVIFHCWIKYHANSCYNN